MFSCLKHISCEGMGYTFFKTGVNSILHLWQLMDVKIFLL